MDNRDRGLYGYGGGYGHSNYGYGGGYCPPTTYGGYPPAGYPHNSNYAHHSGHMGMLAGGAAAAAALYGTHHLSHGHHQGMYGQGFYGHGHGGKFKHGKFGKHGHGYGGKFKKWK